MLLSSIIDWMASLGVGNLNKLTALYIKFNMCPAVASNEEGSKDVSKFTAFTSYTHAQIQRETHAHTYT